MLIHRYTKANNKYMGHCDKYKESSCINCQKANNWYGKCEMSDVMCGVIGMSPKLLVECLVGLRNTSI